MSTIWHIWLADYTARFGFDSRSDKKIKNHSSVTRRWQIRLPTPSLCWRTPGEKEGVRTCYRRVDVMRKWEHQPDEWQSQEDLTAEDTSPPRCEWKQLRKTWTRTAYWTHEQKAFTFVKSSKARNNRQRQAISRRIKMSWELETGRKVCERGLQNKKKF